jgi:alpha-methylacyl-CoA racemase
VGPLAGFRIIEVAGLGPGPFCGMMLGDMGAEVIRIDRPGTHARQRLDPLCRNRRSIVLDLKSPPAVEVLLRLVESADALYEGFRPGVAERLGFGPEACMARNPRLVYGRVTGWGQDGPLAMVAGHDINYIALSGALAGVGRAGEPPVPPLNLVGDFGGGGMLLAFGLVCALLEASRSGKGQVIDAAMIDGANALMATFHGFRALGLYDDRPGTHFLSGAAHYYDTYETRDGKHVSIGALEPQFYRLLIEKAGLDPGRFAAHGFDFRMDPATLGQEHWPGLKAELARVFRSKTRDAVRRRGQGTSASPRAGFLRRGRWRAPACPRATLQPHPACAARDCAAARAGCAGRVARCALRRGGDRRAGRRGCRGRLMSSSRTGTLPEPNNRTPSP